jgi:hypothetical protein
LTIHLNKGKSKRSIDPELVSEEKQDQTGYYDYGFHQLDPPLCRWHVVDAMVEMYMST